MMTLTGLEEMSGEPETSLCGLWSFNRLPGLVYMVAGFQGKQKRARSLLVTYLLLSHQPKQVTWASPDSRTEKNSLHLMKTCKATLHTMERICGHFANYNVLSVHCKGVVGSTQTRSQPIISDGERFKTGFL